MSPDIIRQFAEYGGYIGLLMGLMVVGMGTAIVFLWRRNTELQDKLHEVHNKRVEEAKEVRKELLALNDETTKAVLAMGHAINALKDAVILRDR